MVSPNASLHKEDKLLYPDHHLKRYAKSGFRPAHIHFNFALNSVFACSDVEMESDHDEVEVDGALSENDKSSSKKTKKKKKKKKYR